MFAIAKFKLYFLHHNDIKTFEEICQEISLTNLNNVT